MKKTYIKPKAKAIAIASAETLLSASGRTIGVEFRSSQTEEKTENDEEYWDGDYSDMFR